MESKNQPFEITGYRSSDQAPDATINYPNNLFIIGTVNVDETTYMFSPKVLDRSNVIEFSPSHEELFNNNSDQQENIEQTQLDLSLSEDFMNLRNEINNNKAESINKEAQSKLMKVLELLYKKMEGSGFEFAFRTIKEARDYVRAAGLLGRQSDPDELIDEVIVQKVLPKIHGSQAEIGQLLSDLNEAFKTPIDDKVLQLPLSTAKIENMQLRLERSQYASYI
jgi:hypothetical protein